VFVKAFLICEDVRFELPGSVSLVGVQREVVHGVASEHGAVWFPRLVGVAMIGGLAGLGEVQHRFTLRGSDGASSRERPFASEVRDRTADEHVFLFGNAPMTFPAPGRYELELELVARGERSTYRYAFQVETLDPA
jgi:hypothetical protein